jgi:hypothetical protein
LAYNNSNNNEHYGERPGSSGQEMFTRANILKIAENLVVQQTSQGKSGMI